MRRIIFAGRLEPVMILTENTAQHLLYSLRVRKGEQFLLSDVSGHTALVEVTACTTDSVRVSLLEERIQDANESPLDITLVQALPKGDKMELIVQKATELGVSKIIPVVTKHTVVKYDARKALKKVEKWQIIAKEAAQQCGRSTVPEIASMQTLAKWLEGSSSLEGVFACYEGEKEKSLYSYINTVTRKEYAFLVGPEGGFAPEEMQRLRERGGDTVSLGRRILRTETVALAVLSILQYQSGDLGH